MSGVRQFGLAVAKEAAMLDHLGNLRGDHILPRGVLFFDSPQDVARENVQHAFIEIVELLNPAALDEVTVQAVQVPGHPDILYGPEFSRGWIAQGIDVNSQVFRE